LAETFLLEEKKVFIDLATSSFIAFELFEPSGVRSNTIQEEVEAGRKVDV
jgi:hypothetical protein